MRAGQSFADGQWMAGGPEANPRVLQGSALQAQRRDGSDQIERLH
jgi:hypothetical protein